MRARATGAGESSKDHCIGLAGRVCSQILVCFARALCWEKAHIQAGGQTPPLRPRAQQRVRAMRSRSPPAGALSPAPDRLWSVAKCVPRCPFTGKYHGTLLRTCVQSRETHNSRAPKPRLLCMASTCSVQAGQEHCTWRISMQALPVGSCGRALSAHVLSAHERARTLAQITHTEDNGTADSRRWEMEGQSRAAAQRKIQQRTTAATPKFLMIRWQLETSVMMHDPTLRPSEPRQAPLLQWTSSAAGGVLRVVA